MTHDPSQSDDKFELHYRQQLSALVDGELAPDEARFLLRRLQHDTELSGRFERWQLCGDVLRGQVRRATAPDFGERVAARIASEPAAAAQPQAAGAGGRRLAWTRWGGGAALAASVAAVAMLVGQQLEPGTAPAPVVAMQSRSLPPTQAVLAAGTPATVRADAPVSPAAPIARPVARAARAALPSVVEREPLRNVAIASAADAVRAPARAAAAQAAVAVAEILPSLAATDPFASAAPLQARPWPRAALSRPTGDGFTASFAAPAGTRPFYPFEPHLPAQAAADALPEPPDDGQR